MKMLIYVLALLLCSCSAKRKLKESSRTDINQSMEVQRNSVVKATAQSYQADSAFLSYVNRFKIYPRGEIRMTKEGFTGVVDSLIWYGKGQQTNNSQLLTTASRTQLVTEDVNSKNSYVNEARKKDLTKVGTSFLWIIGGIGVLLIFFFLYGRVRRKLS